MFTPLENSVKPYQQEMSTVIATHLWHLADACPASHGCRILNSIFLRKSIHSSSTFHRSQSATSHELLVMIFGVSVSSTICSTIRTKTNMMIISGKHCWQNQLAGHATRGEAPGDDFSCRPEGRGCPLSLHTGIKRSPICKHFHQRTCSNTSSVILM